MQNSKKLLCAATFAMVLGMTAQAQADNTGQYIDDATMTTKVKAALLTDAQLKATKISVKTDQGIVQLTGTVATKTQEAEALRVANQVDGVKSTQDLLTVKEMQEP